MPVYNVIDDGDDVEEFLETTVVENLTMVTCHQLSHKFLISMSEAARALDAFAEKNAALGKRIWAGISEGAGGKTMVMTSDPGQEASWKLYAVVDARLHIE
eukprot:TRINITY_DN19882_c0_g1_i1.p1 TRINITY_DN19882_c0_g1~~TRINITY_DN19882_c0_g1_i1.p1  ORF type:complete len:101 (+),score=8.89 TRINITY_DN19882_c0_g1_i1:46-348(+)